MKSAGLFQFPQLPFLLEHNNVLNSNVIIKKGILYFRLGRSSSN